MKTTRQSKPPVNMHLSINPQLSMYKANPNRPCTRAKTCVYLLFKVSHLLKVHNITLISIEKEIIIIFNSS